MAEVGSNCIPGYYELYMTSIIALDEKFSFGIQQLAHVLPAVWKVIAIYGVLAIPVVLVWYWFARDRLTALRVAVAGVFAWFGLSHTIGRIVGRVRPPQLPFLHFPPKELLFMRPGASFPSNHAAFMTAILVSFILAGDRKLTPFLAAVTILTLFARVVTAQHWAGDILMGIVVGIAASYLVQWLQKPLDRWLLKPIVVGLRKIGL